MELVNKIFCYLSSPTASLISNSTKFFNNHCTIRFLRGGLEGHISKIHPYNVIVEEDYHTFYATYVTSEFLYERYKNECMKQNRVVEMEKEIWYCELYEDIYHKYLQSIQKIMSMSENTEEVPNKEWILYHIDKCLIKYSEDHNNIVNMINI